MLFISGVTLHVLFNKTRYFQVNLHIGELEENTLKTVAYVFILATNMTSEDAIFNIWIAITVHLALEM